MPARVRTVLALSLLATAVLGFGPAHAKTELYYSVKEARAYAYKASLSKEAIEAAPDCNPDEDPYECDESKYNHKLNCPKALTMGAKGRAPKAKPAPESESVSGRGGDVYGPENSPPQSSPVRLNRFLSLAKISHIGGLLEAGGLASDTYIDLSGRNEPEAHTESEAFSNRPDYEERCYPEDAEGNIDKANYEHFLSRSGERPDTYHLAECFERNCNFGLGINAEHARSIVSLSERSGVVKGTLRSSVQGLNFGDGGLIIDSMVTFVTFSSDGTPGGLKWSVASTASGAKVGGQPVALPPGRTVAGPGFSVGVAEPYVDTSEDGGDLTVVAPGLHFGSDQQSAFFGGIEIYAGMGREAPFTFSTREPAESASATTTTVTGGTGGTTVPSSDTSLPAASGGTGDAVENDDTTTASDELVVTEIPTGTATLPLIFAFAGLCWFVVMSRWLQRYPWGRNLADHQPFKLIDWIYRAFVKT